MSENEVTEPDETGDEATGERFMRFHAMYREVLQSEFDALEFAEDDLYAFQVLDRAFRSDNQDLRNLAAHLQTQREAALETITMRATEINESTRRLKTLELRVLERRGETGDAAPVAPDSSRAARAHVGIDMATTKIDLIDGRYVVLGELINTGTAAGSTRRLKLVFRAGDQVLAERAMPLIEGPIAPGARRRFSLPLDEPPSGATNIVPTVD